MKMKIGVISDTHIPDRASDLPKNIYRDFKGLDLILHAGDLTELEVLDKLKALAPVKAVYGNMDSFSVKNNLPEKEIIKIDNLKIALMHGRGDHQRLIPLLKEEFKKDKPNVIIFGHAHYPVNEFKDKVLFFNPGSPTDKIFSPYHSYGILEIDDNNIEAKIIKL